MALSRAEERRVPPQRRNHWHQVYTEKSASEVSWYQEEPALSLRLIREAGISRSAPIIDVGAGASVLVDRLLSEGYTRVAVLDISASALAVARARLGRLADSVEWYEADVTAFDPPHPFTLWHDRATFHFLTEAPERARYVDVLKRAVSVYGHVVIATFSVGGPEKCSGLDVVQYDAARMTRELGAEFKLVSQAEETHVTPAGKEQPFSYFSLVRLPSREHVDEELDEALRGTFPASDPTAVSGWDE